MTNPREFKFRAWNKKGTCFISEDHRDHTYISLEGNLMMLISKYDQEFGHDFNIGDNLIIQQFTGCLDKNGKEIYEGDIVRSDESFTFVPTGERVEKYNIYDIRFEVPESFDVSSIGFNFKNCDPIYLEVIGNIFENPDLLMEE